MAQRIAFLAVLITGVMSCATMGQTAPECEEVAAREITTVFQAYERYRDNGLHGHLVNDARRALEKARFALHGDLGLPGAPTCPPSQRRRASFRDLSDDFEAADALVKELEEVRGVRFVELRGEQIIWTNATTGAEVPPQMAGKL